MDYKFTDTEFMSAKDKELVLKQWLRFITNPTINNFTDRLYKHLSLHCSFIAHYSREGFYTHYFVDPEYTGHFFQQFDGDKDHISYEYGASYWLTTEGYADINRAMCDKFEILKSQIYEDLHQGTLVKYKDALKKAQQKVDELNSNTP